MGKKDDGQKKKRRRRVEFVKLLREETTALPARYAH
jgi:hypothetical protein